jgi:hypothetical protein
MSVYVFVCMIIYVRVYVCIYIHVSCFIKKNISDFSVDIFQNIDDNGMIKLKVSMSMSVYVFVCMIIYVRVYICMYIYMYHVLSKKILVILVWIFFRILIIKG